MMEGKTIEERARYGYTVLHRTQDLIKAKYPDLQIVYKREWQERKSGRNKGQSCPHYHFMAYGPGWTDEQYTEMFTRVALKWVRYSKTEEVGKALAVIMHRKSFGFLRENDRYVTYFAKYVSKKSTIKALTLRRPSEDVTCNDVLRELLGLDVAGKSVPSSIQPSTNSFTCQGRAFLGPTASKAMRDIFRFLAGRDATFLERFDARKHGKKRRYIGRSQADLYPGRPDLRKHSLEIIPGWWIGTNYSKGDMEKIVRLAEEVAGAGVG